MFIENLEKEKRKNKMGNLLTLTPKDGNKLVDLAATPGRIIAFFDNHPHMNQPLLIAGIGPDGFYNEIAPKKSSDIIILREPPCMENRQLLSTQSGIVHIYVPGTHDPEEISSPTEFNYTAHYAWVGEEKVLEALDQEPLLSQEFNQYSLAIRQLCKKFGA